jgi:GTPase Era involved in 16S rRNA processing
MAKMFVAKQKNDAKVLAFAVKSQSSVDLLYYVVDNANKAKGDALWFYEDDKNNATSTLFWVNEEYEANLKVFRVENDYDAQWKKSNNLRDRL